jgi:hypothetical protein
VRVVRRRRLEHRPHVRVHERRRRALCKGKGEDTRPQWGKPCARLKRETGPVSLRAGASADERGAWPHRCPSSRSTTAPSFSTARRSTSSRASVRRTRASSPLRARASWPRRRSRHLRRTPSCRLQSKRRSTCVEGTLLRAPSITSSMMLVRATVRGHVEPALVVDASPCPLPEMKMRRFTPPHMMARSLHRSNEGEGEHASGELHVRRFWQELDYTESDPPQSRPERLANSECARCKEVKLKFGKVPSSTEEGFSHPSPTRSLGRTFDLPNRDCRTTRRPLRRW